MNTISTHIFEFQSHAQPEQVWVALTRADLTRRYLFGMAVESAWRRGSPVTFRIPDGLNGIDSPVGEVLVADEPVRLSYTLTTGATQPTTYVTWEIRAAEDADGSHVRLSVDETQTASDEVDAEAGETWGRVVTALQSVLGGLRLL